MISLELYHQTCTYDTGNNLINLSHQASSGNWQQTLTIHPNSNRGTETQQSTSNFDANGNLLVLDNIANLDWHYNNTLNQLTKVDKPNTTQYYVYDYQGNRVRSVVESDHQTQSQRDYLPSLELSTNQEKQQSSTLHIGTHILSENSKDNTQSPNQTHYQLTSHLQSNTLELDDQAQTLSYEHYYPYGGTAIIAGKDKTQAQQKRYRYTSKERDDSSGLSYYGARYLAPWLARWISPDSQGFADGLNLFVYVGNNPLQYIDLTGHVKVYPANKGKPYKIDILDPIDETYRNDNLLYYPEAYQRLQETVRSDPKLTLLDSNTHFTIISNKPLKIQAEFTLAEEGGDYSNIMNFSTGVLHFRRNYKEGNDNINATQVTAYQYLGMTKIARALNQLPKTFFRYNILNPTTNTIIREYEDDKNYSKFRHDFMKTSDHGRSSWRIADALGLKIITSNIEIEYTRYKHYKEDHIRLHLKQQKTLRDSENPLVLPFRISYVDYHTPIKRQKERSATL
jgi:RHS repeat-associated protein